MRRHLYTLKNPGGFTLVEMMISVLISAAIMGAVYATYQAQRKSMTNQQSITAMQQDLRAATVVLERDLREAGVDPFDPPAGAGFITATSTSIQFTRDIGGDLISPNEADGILDDLDETVAFRLNNDADNDGIVDGGVPGANWTVNINNPGAIARNSMNPDGTMSGFQVMAPNIDALEFNYLLEDGTQTLAPTNLNLIRAVQVSVLSRSGRADPQFTNTLTYTPGSGAVIWNPPDDGFRRRLSIVTVYCRNLEF